MNTQTHTQTYHTKYPDALVAYLEKTNRKARKHGYEQVSWTVGEPEHEEEQRTVHVIGTRFAEDQTYRREVAVYPVEVEGPLFQIKGWTFAARVEHGDDHSELNLIKAAPWVEKVPVRYRKTDSSLCEHCNQHRRRNDTYLISNAETGEWKQVGSTCLKDFLQVASPDAFLFWGYLFEAIGDEVDRLEDEHRGSGPARSTHFEKTRVADVAAAWIRRNGYVSVKASTSDTDKTPTVMEVMKVLDRDALRAIALADLKHLPASQRDNACEQIQRDYDLAERFEASITAEDRKFAGEALKWMARGNGNEYLVNLRALEDRSVIKNRDMALFVSGFQAYRRELKFEADNAGKKSEHVGKVNERIELGPLTVKVARRLPDNGFGPSMLYVYEDEERRQFKWFTGSNFDFEVGDRVEGKATVKAHEYYRDLAQTVLTRCSFKMIED